MDTVLLIDFLCLVHKGNVSFGGEKNLPFTIHYSFFRNLSSLIKEFSPDKVFLCGEGGRSFRKDISGDYKANRVRPEGKKKANGSVFEAANAIWKLCRHLPLHRVSADRYEADDVIATLAASLHDEDVIVVSNDKDYLQLLQMGNDNVALYDPFLSEFREAPSYDQNTFLCLNGDAADNIAGLLPKSAAIKAASNPEKLKAFLADDKNRSRYALNKQLVDLRTVPDADLQVLDYEADFEALFEEFAHMEFKSILKDKEGFKKVFAKLR